MIVKRSPQRSERAWKGDIKGQPVVQPRSRTGAVSNVYKQRNRYAKFVSKAPSGKDKPFSNRAAISKAARIGTDTSPKNWRKNVITSTGQRPFVTRGRKNVYWGKTRITEKATTKDLTGKAVRTRNFRSSGMGLTGEIPLLSSGVSLTEMERSRVRRGIKNFYPAPKGKVDG